MTVDFDHYRKLREDAFGSYERIVDMMPPGYGGSTQTNSIMLNDGCLSITAVNTHVLQYQVANDINIGKIETPYLTDVITPFGKTAILPEFIQDALDVPECYCDLHEHDQTTFNIFKTGFLPSNWCEDLCPFKDGCCHKLLMYDLWQSTRESTKCGRPMLLNMTKAYIKTGLIKAVLKKYNKPNFFYDENPLNYIMEQITLSAYSLDEYVKQIDLLIGYDYELSEFWKPFRNLIGTIIYTIRTKYNQGRGRQYDKKEAEVFNRKKFKDLETEINSFFDSYPKSITFKNWNNKVCNIIMKNKIKIKFNNPFKNFLKLMQDYYKHHDLYNSSLIDNQGTAMGYYIDNRNELKWIMDNTRRTIIRSGYSRFDEMFKIMFDDDDFAVLKEPKNLQFDAFFRYTSGTYYKSVLCDKNKLTESFKNLVKEIKKIISSPYFDGEQFVICTIKEGINYIKKVFKDRDDLHYMWWYNTEGENLHEGYIPISIGAPIQPSKISDIYLHKVNIPTELTKHWITEGEQNQYFSRGRPHIIPGLIAFSFSSILPDKIDEDIVIDFNSAQDVFMLYYLKTHGFITAEEILEKVYNKNDDKKNKNKNKKTSLWTIQNKLLKLFNSGLVKRDRKDKNSKYKYSLVKESKL